MCHNWLGVSSVPPLPVTPAISLFHEEQLSECFSSPNLKEVPHMSIPSLTIDTSCVISLLHLPEDSTPADELNALEQIQAWGETGRFEIFISEKSRTEAILNLEKARNIDPANRARSEKWLQTLNNLERYESLKGRWIVGVSRLGIDTVPGSDAESADYEDMARVLFGTSPTQLKNGDVFDLAILFEHYTQGNYIFVTRDRKNNMLQKKAELKQKWNIVVCNPVDAMKILESTN
jgi:hypothetical protein